MIADALGPGARPVSQATHSGLQPDLRARGESRETTPQRLVFWRYYRDPMPKELVLDGLRNIGVLE